MEKKIDYFEHYRNEFSHSELRQPQGTTPELQHLKQTAMEYFLAKGFPSTKDEEWRFTNTQILTKTNFVLPTDSIGDISYEKTIEKIAIPVKDARRVLFINGKYIPLPSDGLDGNDGIVIRTIKQAIQENHPLLRQYLSGGKTLTLNAMTALNTGLFDDGIILHVPDNTVVTNPYYFIFLTQTEGNNHATYPRSLIVIGKNSKITVIEHYLSETKSIYFTNAVTELYLDSESAVEHIKLQLESSDAYHISSLTAHQKTGSNLTQHSVMIGGALARNEISTILADEQIECTLNGLSLVAGKQLVDNHTSIDHTKPHCTSHELYKAILDGSAKGIFNGKIFVRKDAQKTDAKQTNKTLLLSDNATMNTKPQLEIFADDVKCTHGAAIGYLDAEAIFYLRSRGISEEIARDLLTYAFANDVISRIPIGSIREYLNHLVYTRLKQGRELETI
jgi:Fe-S cluster assembly protein SufD